VLLISGTGTWQHFVMPGIVLAFTAIPALTRLTRSGMIEAMASDYIRTARAKGLAERIILSRHAIKNAMLPVVTLFGLQLGFLLGPPAAVPRELDDATLAVAFDDERPDEIRAARPSVNAQAIDGPFGVRVEQLVDEADHLDARNWPHQGDRGRFSALGERDDIGFETFGRERTLDDLGVYRHGRNISGVPWFLGVHAAPSRTKLTVGSAHVSREIPWLR